MAATYLLKGTGIQMSATNQSILHLYNAAGSSSVIRVFRVWVENSQVTVPASASGILALQRITMVVASNWNLEPVSYDNTNAVLIPTLIITTTNSSTNCTVTDGRNASSVLTVGQKLWFSGMNATPPVTVATAPAATTFTVSANNTAANSVVAQIGNITAGSKATVTLDTAGIYKKIGWTQATNMQALGRINEQENNYMWGSLFDAGYNDYNVEPITLRAGEGISIQNLSFTVGAIDAFMEITVT